MINFWKLYKKAASFFQISSEIRKGAAQSLTAYDWHSSKDASQHVCIYGTIKNRVHILPLIFKLISAYCFWISLKNTLDAGIWSCPRLQIPEKTSNFRSQVSTTHNPRLFRIKYMGSWPVFLEVLPLRISVLNVFCISTSPQYFSLVIIPRTVASLHSSPPCRNRVRVECIPNHT